MFKKIFPLKFRTLLIIIIVATVLNLLSAEYGSASRLLNYIMGFLNGASWIVFWNIYEDRKEGLDV